MYLNLLLVLFFANALLGQKERAEPKAEISGVGQIKVRADYVHLSFNIRSECYDTPSEAQDAADQVAKKVYQQLESLRKPEDKHFKILSSGGFTSSYTRWLQNKEICRNTFQKATEITLNIGLNKEFSALFTRIQEQTLNFYRRDISGDGADKAQTFVTLGIPEPRIERTRRLSLEKDARSLALVDAQANFKEMVKTCAPKAFQIVNIKEAQSSGFPLPVNRLYQQNAQTPNAQAADTTPVRFDDLIITKELIVTFEVDGALCLVPNQ